MQVAVFLRADASPWARPLALAITQPESGRFHAAWWPHRWLGFWIRVAADFIGMYQLLRICSPEVQVTVTYLSALTRLTPWQAILYELQRIAWKRALAAVLREHPELLHLIVQHHPLVRAPAPLAVQLKALPQVAHAHACRNSATVVLSADSCRLDLSRRGAHKEVATVLRRWRHIRHLTVAGRGGIMADFTKSHYIAVLRSWQPSLRSYSVQPAPLPDAVRGIQSARLDVASIFLIAPLTRVTFSGIQMNQSRNAAVRYFAQRLSAGGAQLRALQLDANGLHGGHLAAIARAFSRLISLTHLDLSSNKLAAADADELARPLTALRALRSFAVSGNPLGDGGVANIVRGLLPLAHLRELSMDDCDMGTVGSWVVAKLLRSHTLLMRLDVCNAGIRSAGSADLLQSLVECVPQLTQLSVGGQHRADGCKLSAALSRLTNLRSLVLKVYQLRPVGAERAWTAVQQLLELTQLHVSSPLPPQGLQLAPLAQLRAVRLSVQGEVNAPDAAALVSQLERLRCLTELRVTHTELGHAGVLQFVRCVALLSRLVVLHLAHVDLPHASAVALAARLATLTRLRELSLAGGTFRGEGAAAVARSVCGLSALTRVDLSGTAALGDAGIVRVLREVENAPQLRALDLRHTGKRRLNMSWVRRRCCLHVTELLIS